MGIRNAELRYVFSDFLHFVVSPHADQIFAVLQTCLDYSDSVQRQTLINGLRPLLPAIRNVGLSCRSVLILDVLCQLLA